VTEESLGRHFGKPAIDHRPCCPSGPVLARPRRPVRCPGSRAIRLQGLQDHPPEGGALADGAETRSTMQIAGDASYAVDPGARPATVLLIHDVFLLRTRASARPALARGSPQATQPRAGDGTRCTGHGRLRTARITLAAVSALRQWGTDRRESA
jgi:hypothetical protein